MPEARFLQEIRALMRKLRFEEGYTPARAADILLERGVVDEPRESLVAYLRRLKPSESAQGKAFGGQHEKSGEGSAPSEAKQDKEEGLRDSAPSEAGHEEVGQQKEERTAGSAQPESAQEAEKEQEETSKPQEPSGDLLAKAEEVFRRLEGVLKEAPEKVAQVVEEAPQKVAQAVEEKKEVLKEVIPPIVAKSLEEERKQVLEEVERTKEEVKTLCDKFPELCRIYIAEAIKEKLEEAGEKPEVKEDVHTMTEGFEKVPPSAYLDFLEEHVPQCPSCKEVKDKIAQKLLEVGKKLGGVLPEEKEAAPEEEGEKVIQFPKEADRGERKSGWWFDY